MLFNKELIIDEIRLDMKLLFVHLLMSILFIIIVSGNGIITATTTAVAVSSPTFDIFSIDSSPHGIPYSEWVAKWWIWWAGIPIFHLVKLFYFQ